MMTTTTTASFLVILFPSAQLPINYQTGRQKITRLVSTTFSRDIRESGSLLGCQL